MSNPVAIAVAVVTRGGRVLMAHRTPDRSWYPDCWDLVGGHVEAGESPEQALIRECAEELGIRVHAPRSIAMSFADPGVEMHAFVVDHWEGEPVNAAPDEHSELAWFEPADLASLTLADPTSLADIVRAVGAADPPGHGGPGTVPLPRVPRDT